ncbi:MAG: glycosyltransferase family 2 protein [Bacteroidales bacterium]|nr:glycosyltransferase family 2 protein [Bacteroidales bacterium]
MKFSIIIPTYNRASFLPKAIESVLAQTYTEWELIIVDDGSTDNTKEVVSKYNDSRITYIYQKNAERSAARNNGILHANGNYICFMDSDGYLAANRLELLKVAIENSGNQEAIFYTDIQFKKNSGVYIRTGLDFDYPINVNKLIKIIIGTPQWCCSASILQQFKFNPLLSIGEDMELLFRITDEYPLIYIPNQATITEIEHENRSVAFNNRSIASEKEIKTLKTMFSVSHPANRVRIRYKFKRLANAYFNASTNYILDMRWKGAKYLIYSILLDIFSLKSIYKANILLSFFMKNEHKLKKLYDI